MIDLRAGDPDPRNDQAVFGIPAQKSWLHMRSGRNQEKFFEEVELHTLGEVIYIPVNTAVSEKGKVFLEVRGDYYAPTKNFSKEARKQLERPTLT